MPPELSIAGRLSQISRQISR